MTLARLPLIFNVPFMGAAARGCKWDRLQRTNIVSVWEVVVAMEKRARWPLTCTVFLMRWEGPG